MSPLTYHAELNKNWQSEEEFSSIIYSSDFEKDVHELPYSISNFLLFSYPQVPDFNIGGLHVQTNLSKYK